MVCIAISLKNSNNGALVEYWFIPKDFQGHLVFHQKRVTIDCLFNISKETETYWFVTNSNAHHCLSPIALERCLKRAIYIIHVLFVKSSVPC